jgi:hypothetical protein
MKRIGFVTYLELPTINESDQLLLTPLRKEGFKVEATAWDDTNIDWSKYDYLILRSCWNYYRNYEKFFIWLSYIEKLNIPTWNPTPIIRWNANKKYLKELEYKGIPIIPTVFIEKGTTYNLIDIAHHKKWNDLVIKPAVGVFSYNVKVIKQNEFNKGQTIFKKLSQQSDVLIQPYISIMKNKEYSLVFLGGKYSHTVIKQSGNRGTIIYPDASIIQQAKKILQKIHSPLLYTRVDGIIIDDVFMLSELELIEPYLFFTEDKKSPTRFVRAFKALM